MDMEGMGGLHLRLEYGSMGGRWDIVGDRGRYGEVDQQRTTLREVSGYDMIDERERFESCVWVGWGRGWCGLSFGRRRDHPRSHRLPKMGRNPF